jgi:rhamnosyltransferase
VFLSCNEGIGYAQNVGIRKALLEEISHVIIFDQDSVISSGFVNSLLQCEKEAHNDGVKVGIIGPIYKSYSDNYSYPIRTVENGKLIVLPIDSFDRYKKVSHVIASGSLILKQVFDDVGLLKESFFIGYVDFEFCFRAASKDFKTIITKNAVMEHKLGDKQIDIFNRRIGIYSPFRRYFDCRNTILIQKDEIFPKVIRRYYLKLIFGKIIISLIFGPQRFKQLHYCLKGFFDGICGYKGKCSIK